MLYVARYLIELQAGHWLFAYFYRTQVRSLATLVTYCLTYSVTNSRLVDLIDVTLECEDANSKNVDVVAVVDVDNEDHISNSLLQI